MKTPNTDGLIANDTHAHTIAHLITHGIGQWEATRITLAGQPPALDAPPAAWTSWAHAYVHQAFADLRRQVGLP